MNQSIAALYVAYFYRAPDKAGLQFWNNVATQSGLSNLDLMKAISSGFAQHPTFDATYGGLGNSAFVQAIYINVGGRPGDAAGVQYWTDLINNGMSRADMIANYTYGLLNITEAQLDALVAAGQITPAEKDDALARQDTLLNKVTVGLAFVDAMGEGSNLSPSTDPMNPASLALDPAYQASQAIIRGVDENPASMADELAYLSGTPTIQGILNNFGSPLPGQNLNLTPSIDTINITTSGTKDIVTGIVDTIPAPFGQSTYTVGDSIRGNGLTDLKLLVTNGFGVAQLATVRNVANVDVVFATPAGGNLVLDGLLWSNVGAVNLTQSSAVAPDVTLYVPNLPVGANLSIGVNAAGTLSADYANGIYAWMYADRGSAVSFTNGNVVGIADAGGSASFSLSAQANGINISVGSINMSAPGNDGADSYVGIYNSVDRPGNITVGDVSQTGFEDAYLYISATEATAAAAPRNITVGNITHVARSYSYINIEQESSSKFGTGNVTVGNVSVSLGKNATGYAYISNTGYNKIGDIKVGDVMIDLAAGAYHDFYINNSVDDYSASDDVSAGNVTVGNLTYKIGQDATAYFTLYNSVSSSYGNATAGNVSVGNISAAIGQYAYFDVYIDLEAYVSWTSTLASVGALTIGNITLVAAASSSFEFTAEASAYNWGGPGATVGQFTVGNINVDMGVNSYGYMEFSAYAYGTDDSKVNIAGLSMGDINIAVRDSSTMYLYQYAEAYGGIGNMSYGNMNVRADVNSYVSLYFSASVSTDIGNVTVGNILLDAAGKSATAYANFDYYAYGNIGNVTFGNVKTVAAKDAYAGLTLTVEATDGDIGNVTLGNLDLAAATNADASQYYYVTATDGAIGNITVGAVNAVAKGKSAYAYMSFEAYASDGDIGNVSVGNVSALGSGENAFGGAYFYYYAEDDVGTVKLGNLSAQAKGKNSDSYVSITVSADTGSVGDVTIGNLSAKATGEGAYAYVSVDVYGDDGVGNVTIGNATISSEGKNAYAYAYVYVTADSGGGSNIGNIVAGNVTMNVKGENAYGWYGLTASSVDDIGSMTVGNLDLSVGNLAKTKGAYLEVDIYMSASDDAGSMTVGNITLTGTTVRAAGDNTMAYKADVYIWNDDGALTVGNITVKGGDGLADNFASLGSWLTLGGTSVTIGGVDYSGYGAAATIDVSGYKGAPTIKGGSKADIITDNKGTNVMTGGAGADTFVIVTDNANKTLATMDKITDFSQSGGDRIDLPFVVVPGIAGNYTEQGGLADFAAYLAAADAANKQVFVGQVTGQNGVILAFDFDNNGTVDTLLQLVGVGLNDIDHLAFS